MREITWQEWHDSNFVTCHSCVKSCDMTDEIHASNYVTCHSCHSWHEWHEWHVTYFDAWVSTTGGMERAQSKPQYTKSLFSVSSDFSRFEWESLAIIRNSEYWVGISGDNPSFRIYKRQKTHAVLCLANVVSLLLYTRGWCHSWHSCHSIMPCPSDHSQNVCREWHEWYVTWFDVRSQQAYGCIDIYTLYTSSHTVYILQ